MTGQIVNDYQTLKAGAQALSQFGASLQQMSRQFKQIHQQLKDHCAGDESGIGGAVEQATSDAAEAGGAVFGEGGRVLSQMGSRTETNTERTFTTDQTIADTLTGIAKDGPQEPPEPGSVASQSAASSAGVSANSTLRPPEVGANQPIENVRPYGPGQGSLRRDDPRWQQAMEDGFPKDAQGDPVKYADPRTGWVANGNDGGVGVDGRANNCADCSRSFLESWFGRPTCSQPRIPDLNSSGTYYREPERDANKNLDDYTGAVPSWCGERHEDPYQAVSDRLLATGPGSAAIVHVAWQKQTLPDGSEKYTGGHAFNACNVNGQVVWVDMQLNIVSDAPIHQNAAAVWATVLNAQERAV